MNNYNKLWMTIQMKLFVIVTLIGKCQVLLHSARPYANYLGLTKWIPFLVFLLSKAIWSHDESKSLPFSDWSNIGGQQQKPWNIDSGLIAFCSAYLNFFFQWGQWKCFPYDIIFELCILHKNLKATVLRCELLVDFLFSLLLTLCLTMYGVIQVDLFHMVLICCLI